MVWILNHESVQNKLNVLTYCIITRMWQQIHQVAYFYRSVPHINGGRSSFSEITPSTVKARFPILPDELNLAIEDLILAKTKKLRYTFILVDNTDRRIKNYGFTFTAYIRPLLLILLCNCVLCSLCVVILLCYELWTFCWRVS